MCANTGIVVFLIFFSWILLKRIIKGKIRVKLYITKNTTPSSFSFVSKCNKNFWATRVYLFQHFSVFVLDSNIPTHNQIIFWEKEVLNQVQNIFLMQKFFQNVWSVFRWKIVRNMSGYVTLCPLILRNDKKFCLYFWLC